MLGSLGTHFMHIRVNGNLCATSRFAKNNKVSSPKGIKLLQDKAHSVGWKNLLQLLIGLTALVLCDCTCLQ